MGSRSRTAVAVLLLAGALGAVWWAVGEAGGSEATPAGSRGGAEAGEAHLLAPEDGLRDTERASVAGAEAALARYTVSGRILDQDERPVPGMQVFVGAEENPFREPADAAVGYDHGRHFAVDEAGRFEVELPGPGEVAVYAAAGKMWVRPTGRSSARVEPPVQDLELRVEVQPFGTVIVRALDLSSQKELKDFKASIAGIDPDGDPRAGVYTHGFASTGTTDGRIVSEFPVPYDGGLDVEVTLVKPAVYSDKVARALGAVGLEEPERIAKQIRLHAGETREVTLEIRFDQNVTGLVVDELGLPIEDAIVYFGTRNDARGDEPFKPFDERRVSGTRTDGGGWYELAGSGPVVSAWHPRHSPATVAVEDSVRIVLPRRGELRGRVPEPLPRRGPVEVLLDFRTAIDAEPDGRFVFEDVEAGTHAIVLPGSRVVVARVAPGEVTEVDLAGALDHVRLLLAQSGTRLRDPFHGALVGLGPVSSLLEVIADEGECEWGDVIPGDYVLLSGGGHASVVTIDGPEVRVGLSDAELIVRGRPGHEPLVLPADHAHDPFLRLMAPRIARRIPTEGRLLFAPMKPGPYVVIDPFSGHEERVVVNRGAENLVVLP